jgi:UPF0176 protein
VFGLRLSTHLLPLRIENENKLPHLVMSFVVATFYKFVPFPDYANYRQSLLACCLAQSVKGTILLAPEGINGTIAGQQANIKAVLDVLRSDPRFNDLAEKKSYTQTCPFARLKVKLKQEIVTLGQSMINPCEQVGTYISPQDWNSLITDPAVTVVDTRNDYEVGVGTFVGAQNPQTASFRDFPNYVQQNLDPAKHPKVALFCTGGIRCEKATAYLLQKGFTEVYHLKGGILNYLETVPEAESLWQGECFVFDERVAIEHGLHQGTYQSCRACGHPLSQVDCDSSQYRQDISCPYCHPALPPSR